MKVRMMTVMMKMNVSDYFTYNSRIYNSTAIVPSTVALDARTIDVGSLNNISQVFLKAYLRPLCLLFISVSPCNCLYYKSDTILILSTNVFYRAVEQDRRKRKLDSMSLVLIHLLSELSLS